VWPTQSFWIERCWFVHDSSLSLTYLYLYLYRYRVYIDIQYVVFIGSMGAYGRWRVEDGAWIRYLRRRTRDEILRLSLMSNKRPHTHFGKQHGRLRKYLLAGSPFGRTKCSRRADGKTHFIFFSGEKNPTEAPKYETLYCTVGLLFVRMFANIKYIIVRYNIFTGRVWLQQIKGNQWFVCFIGQRLSRAPPYSK